MATRAVTAIHAAAEAMLEDGLSPEDRVIVYPSDALRDGAKIEIAAGGR